MFELVIALFVLALFAAMPIVTIVMFIRASRVTELTRRIERLETYVGRLLEAGGAKPITPPASDAPVAAPFAKVAPPVTAKPFVAEPGEGFQWEMFIGQRALGWIAAIVLFFATAFFLRYAFENNWIGPIGRVSLGALGGVVLVVGGWSAFRRDWRVYAQILTGAGIGLLYLATYGAVAFYHILPQEAAFVFLLILMVEAALLALAYDAPALGLMSVIGGLLTPMLMATVQDPYASFFTYLALLNLGAAVMVSRRRWPAVGSVALIGVQVLFWSWYEMSYHPEKLVAALVFQLAVFATCLGQSVAAQLGRGRQLGWEDMARMALNATFAFGAFYVLLRPEYRAWLGTVAVGMAIVYALLAKAALSVARRQRSIDMRLVLTALALAAAFVATAIPLEARADWVAVGWTVEAALLAWFGYRIGAPALRLMGGGAALAAAVRLVFVDTPRRFPIEAPEWPLANDYALPALAVCAVWLATLVALRRFAPRIAAAERAVLAMSLVAGLGLLGLVISVEWLAFCRGQEMYQAADPELWRWTAQTGLSVVWALYATALLLIGFAARNAVVRWTALTLYAATLVKLFLFDLAELHELYRILSFFALALLLGFAAWAYQRMRHVLAAPSQTKGTP